MSVQKDLEISLSNLSEAEKDEILTELCIIASRGYNDGPGTISEDIIELVNKKIYRR